MPDQEANEPLKCKCGEVALPSTGMCPKCTDAAGLEIQGSFRTGDVMSSPMVATPDNMKFVAGKQVITNKTDA